MLSQILIHEDTLGMTVTAIEDTGDILNPSYTYEVTTNIIDDLVGIVLKYWHTFWHILDTCDVKNTSLCNFGVIVLTMMWHIWHI